MTHEAPMFGRSRESIPSDARRRLITPKMLPEKGILYHPNHLRRMWQRGEFPVPIRLSPHRIAWPEEVIDQWIATKVAEGKPSVDA